MDLTNELSSLGSLLEHERQLINEKVGYGNEGAFCLANRSYISTLLLFGEMICTNLSVLFRIPSLRPKTKSCSWFARIWNVHMETWKS